MKKSFFYVAALWVGMACTTGGYGAAFINHTGEFTTAKSCVQQIVEGCIDIAGEVWSQKIGDPISKYQAGNTTEALYAVESWYSWHSREDYRNNIYSIRMPTLRLLVRLGWRLVNPGKRVRRSCYSKTDRRVR